MKKEPRARGRRRGESEGWPFNVLFHPHSHPKLFGQVRPCCLPVPQSCGGSLHAFLHRARTPPSLFRGPCLTASVPVVQFAECPTHRLSEIMNADKKAGSVEAPVNHRIRITLMSRNVKNLEKGERLVSCARPLWPHAAPTPPPSTLPSVLPQSARHTL